MKNKLIMTYGLPGCGKTTWSKEMVLKENYKRINKDDLRAMVDFSKWNKQNEEFIVHARNNLIRLYEGFNIIVDDTNLDPKHEQVLRTIANDMGYDFEVKFFDVPLMECIERDSKRGDKSVGTKVIMGMYERYLKPKKPLTMRDKPSAYIFDMDGTLALMQKRSPFEWHKVGEDKCNEDVARMLRILNNTSNKIIICSGRDEVCRNETKEWLKKHNLKYDELLMRKSDDSRKDYIIKKELYENNIKDKYNILGVFDDRLQVVHLWRELGLTCFQVDWGNF